MQGLADRYAVMGLMLHFGKNAAQSTATAFPHLPVGFVGKGHFPRQCFPHNDAHGVHVGGQRGGVAGNDLVVAQAGKD